MQERIEAPVRGYAAKVSLRMPEVKFGPEAKCSSAVGLGELKVIFWISSAKHGTQ